jgi:hypothetical protein
LTEPWGLVVVTAFTRLLWVPYILDRLMVRGLMDAVGYTFGIPWLRTPAFTVAFLCQAVIAWQLLMR